MAVTATVALSPSTIVAGGPGTTVTVTVNNTYAGGPNVLILGVRPIVYRSGSQQEQQAFQIDTPQIPASIAFGASGKVVFGLTTGDLQVAGAGGGPMGPTSKTFDVGAEVVCNDGSVVYATVATLTVNPSPHS